MKIEQEELLNFERNREGRVSCKSNSREFNCPGLRGLRYNILARKHFWDIFNIIVQYRDTEVPISRCAAVCSWTQWPFDLPTIRTLRTHTRNCFMCVLSVHSKQANQSPASCLGCRRLSEEESKHRVYRPGMVRGLSYTHLLIRLDSGIGTIIVNIWWQSRVNLSHGTMRESHRFVSLRLRWNI